jgi:hypothetical protein
LDRLASSRDRVVAPTGDAAALPLSPARQHVLDVRLLADELAELAPEQVVE